ncbi:MAG: tyrosine recombinase XerC [Chloroflexota bacterium]|nr:hypothetical protein [Chloroflexota bacterium]NOG65680.1 tyrosine-type recombinase/integrase [Chloroflexota bacterium]GIK63841.1 MAG: tyrosine recombinase XerC [Chloroflexota bacterium]
MQLEQALDVFLRQYKPSTRVNYDGILRPLIEWLGTTRDVERITAIELQEWINKLNDQATRFEGHPKRPAAEGQLSAHTIHGRIKTMRAFFNWLVKMDVLPSSQNPVRNIKQKTLPRQIASSRIATDEEIHLITMATFGNVRDYAIVLFMRDTGCRAMEVAGLRLDKLNLSNLTAEVLGKGSVWRDAFFGEECAMAVQRWLTGRPDCTHEYVFSATRKPYAPLTPRAVSDMIERAALKAGIERTIHSHHIRHWRATNLVQQNIDVPTAAAALGDSIPVFEAHYLHTTRERVQEAVRRTAYQSKSSPAKNIIRLDDAI